ncbi:MAG: hypothetical protein QOJ59_3719, partial [Thermomicrobiales bacterium]|nr:hypothetical protein [Thermomicrobiales bacterium]
EVIVDRLGTLLDGYGSLPDQNGKADPARG